MKKPKKQVKGQSMPALERRVAEIEKLLWDVADFNAALVQGIRGYEERMGGMINSRDEWSKPLTRYFRSLDKATAKRQSEEASRG